MRAEARWLTCVVFAQTRRLATKPAAHCIPEYETFQPADFGAVLPAQLTVMRLRIANCAL